MKTVYWFDHMSNFHTEFGWNITVQFGNEGYAVFIKLWEVLTGKSPDRFIKKSDLSSLAKKFVCTDKLLNNIIDNYFQSDDNFIWSDDLNTNLIKLDTTIANCKKGGEESAKRLTPEQLKERSVKANEAKKEKADEKLRSWKLNYAKKVTPNSEQGTDLTPEQGTDLTPLPLPLYYSSKEEYKGYINPSNETPLGGVSSSNLSKREEGIIIEDKSITPNKFKYFIPNKDFDIEDFLVKFKAKYYPTRSFDIVEKIAYVCLIKLYEQTQMDGNDIHSNYRLLSDYLLDSTSSNLFMIKNQMENFIDSNASRHRKIVEDLIGKYPKEKYLRPTG